MSVGRRTVEENLFRSRTVVAAQGCSFFDALGTRSRKVIWLGRSVVGNCSRKVSVKSG